MKTRALLTIACSILCAGFAGWRVYVHANQAPFDTAIVFDPSLSHPEGCEALVGLAEQSFRSDRISKDSTLTVLVLGDASTANEPWQLGRYSFPVTNKVIEGRTANVRRQTELFSDIHRKCETIRRTSISPIFLGVKQAVADLRAHGCKATSHCRLFIDSDLEENAELSIKEALNRTQNSKLVLPTPVDNQGLDIFFCGLATTAGRIVTHSGREMQRASARDPGRDDRLRKIWRSLFTYPELVGFEPYCSTSK
jgi:hypothetical protein